MSRQTRANRKAPPIDSWEDALNRVLRDPARSVKFGREAVRSYVRRQPVIADDGIYAKVSLHYPPGHGSRIEIPVRTQNCTHLQCFDLARHLKSHDRDLLGADASVDNIYISWFCPICKAQAEVRDLHVDGYFDSLLQKYKDLEKVEEVEVISDGSHRPIVRPKVEVFPVSDSPFVRADDGEGERQIDEKPLPAMHLENADEVCVSADAMEITDLSLEEIQRLPETHQLCKAVKRRLLEKFKRDANKKTAKEKSSTAALATTALMAESLGPSGTDDAQLPSGGASEQVQVVQPEVEQLRKALADADHAKLLLQAQNEQLQADLLVSRLEVNRKHTCSGGLTFYVINFNQKTVEANEKEKAQLQLEKRRLETEKTALHTKLEFDVHLAAERVQQAALAETKAQKLQSENGKLHETIANLRHRISGLEASVSFSGTGKRQATEECDGVSAKRGKTEGGTDIEHLLQSVVSSDQTMRERFFRSVLLRPELIFKLLVDSPISETRESFARVLFHFLQEAREDDLSAVGLVNATLSRDDRTITDAVLRLITLVPRNHFDDFLRHPQQFLDLVMCWVKESLDNRKRFINVGGLSILLTVIGREDHRTRSLYCKYPDYKFSVIFDIVYLLLAACCITPEPETSTSAAVMPDSRTAFVFAPPLEVRKWITDAQNAQCLIRLFLQYALGNSTIGGIVCLLCRDNMIMTKMVFAHLHSRRLMLQLEQHNFLNAFRELMVLKDDYQSQRIVLGVRGSDNTDGIKGLMQDFLGMRYRQWQPGKAVKLLDEFTLMYKGEQAVKDVLSKDNDFAMAFLEMTEWLSRQVDDK
ncbi:Ubiquitin carboxyl-terminal hydrolase family protein, partial [Aphelenchoides avenae]